MDLQVEHESSISIDAAAVVVRRRPSTSIEGNHIVIRRCLSVPMTASGILPRLCFWCCCVSSTTTTALRPVDETVDQEEGALKRSREEHPSTLVSVSNLRILLEAMEKEK